MSSNNYLEKVKKLREITGVGFKDCKNAIDETKGDIQKSIELLRKKGIAKASKRMGRTAAEGLICISEKNGKIAMIEINSETDFVAKNNDFINFCIEVSEINFKNAMELFSISKIWSISSANSYKANEYLLAEVSEKSEELLNFYPI